MNSTAVFNAFLSHRPFLCLFSAAPPPTRFPRRQSILVSLTPAFSQLAPQPTSDRLKFCDGTSDVELRLFLRGMRVQSSKDIHVDADEGSLVIKIKQSEGVATLMETKQLYGKIKPAETIWYLDDDELVINLRKQDQELKWPDIVESWESLNIGVLQLLKGTSICLVGNSSEINQKVAQELAVGLGYTPLDTKSLLETYARKSIDSWVLTEGPDAVAEAEEAVLESLSSHVRAIVATLGGKHGAAGRADKWRHLYAGFTVWLSQSEATDEDSAKEEAIKQVYDGCESYSKADVVVKYDSWDDCHAKSVAQASLSALKQLILSDKKLPGKKSLYIRLGCRGDWPNIKPPGWDPSTVNDYKAL
ncbi:probable inactive shikimate kinase like 2, chloroplastic isoform X1 [Beta vulgaris subsp. vulgaris]|uniref:probable inactive shikimate kinase like 2, chloroplastic isoform X1 n=1 Tax=Beta vulgaris subsp. vulgaris TaxID=3555 RepID=UPI002036E644|nr:probable inactive shikimate kinase like 2, chloroplastic isoform X1 [Beta vulgaris subsp. vulgaris]